MTDEKLTVMEAGGGSKRLMYTPHLKKVLKSYQASATKSLHGPNSVMGVWQGSESDDTTSISPPDPLCNLVNDITKEKVTSFATVSETSTAKKVIPSTSQQASSTVINKDTPEYDPFIAPPPFPIQQPPIFFPADQTRCEKSETILESETISCFNVGGEERLCLPQILNSVLRDFSLPQINYVCDTLHIYCSRCNQDQLEVLKATGILPCNASSCGLITKTDAQRLCAALLDSNPLIVTKSEDMKPPFQINVYHECFGECHGLYTPDLYQHPLAPCIECIECHALLSPQKFVCHVHHPKETRTCHWGFDVQKWRAYILLDIEHEEEVQFQQALLEMKERFNSKRKQTLEETCDPSPKRVHLDKFFSYPFGMDPMLIYYYSHAHLWDNAFQAYPSVITKDGKTLYIPPDSFPQFFQKSMHSICNRLTLNPANVQKLIPTMKMPEEQTVFSYRAHKSETISKRPHIKKDPDHDSISCFDSEDAYSDTSFSTLSAGTEDGLVSNLEDDEELQPSTESEFLELKKVLTDVDASLCTKIMSEVETLIAKYRKCLNVAVQGKKLYQMELEKLHYSQREKLRKLRERNKCLERELKRFRKSAPMDVSTTEQSESQNVNVTSNPLSPHSSVAEKDSTRESNISKSKIDNLPPEETDLKEVEETISASSPTQPKQTPNPEAEPLGK